MSELAPFAWMMLGLVTLGVAWGTIEDLSRTKPSPKKRSRPLPDDQPRRFTGSRAGRRYVLDQVTTSPRGTRPRRSISLKMSLDPPEAGLTVRRQSTPWAIDLSTGDAAFDREVYLLGDDARVLAALDHVTRERIRKQLKSADLELADTALRLRIDGTTHRKDAVLREACAFLDQFPGTDLDRRLAENAHRDPLNEVRARNLEALTSHFPGSPHLNRVIPHALKSLHAPLRLVALQWVTTHGSEANREAAIELALAEGATAEEKGVALESIAERGDARFLPAVLRWVDAPEPDVQRGVISALHALEAALSPEARRGLLTHEGDAVRLLAIHSLGEHGTIEDVEHLLPLAARGAAPSDVREAAGTAIRNIQGRLGNVEQGRLSIAMLDASEGALSVAPDDGALSLASPSGSPRPIPTR